MLLGRLVILAAVFTISDKFYTAACWNALPLTCSVLEKLNSTQLQEVHTLIPPPTPPPLLRDTSVLLS